MLEGIPFPLETLTPSALLAIVIVLMLTGRLVPAKTVAEYRADRDARVAEAREEANYWRQAWESERVAGRLKDENMAVLMESSRTTVAVLRSLQRAAGVEEATS